MPSYAQNLTDDLSSLFENSPLPCFVIHATSLQVVSANKTALQLFQYPLNELQKSRFIQLISPGEQWRFHYLLQHSKASAESANGLFELKKKEAGAVRAMLYVSSFNRKGEAYCQVICMDVQPAFQPEQIKGVPQQIQKTAFLDKIEKTRLLASLVEATSDVLTAADLEFKPISWNKASEKIYGITAEQAIGTDLRTLIDISYAHATREEVRAAIKSKGEWRGEMTFIRPTDQKKVTLLIRFKLLLDENGVHIGYITAGMDITERKEQELKIKETEDRFRGLADAAPVGIWMSGADNKINYVNKTLLDYTGLSVAEFNNTTWLSVIHPDDQDRMLSTFQTHFLARQPVTLIYRLQTQKDEYRWVQDTGTPRFLEDGTFLGYIGSLVDINDTKKKEEQLQHQAWVLENVQDVVIITDLDNKVTSWNKVAEQKYAITEQEAVGVRLDELVPFHFVSTTLQQVKHLLETKGVWEGEVYFYDKEGHERYFLFTISYFRDGAGPLTGFMLVGHDVTDRKIAEEKLQGSELFYRSLTANALDAILLTDESGRITFASPSINHILGFEADEVLGKSCFDFVHPDDGNWAFESFQKEVACNPDIKSIVIRLRRKNGDWLWCMVRGHNLLNNPHIRGIAIYFHDDSVRKKAKEALKESERRFRNLISDLQIGVLLCNEKGKIIMGNKYVMNLLMVKESDMVDKDVFDVIPDNFTCEDGSCLPREQRPLFLALKEKQPVRDIVLGYRQSVNHERVWLLVNADPVVDGKGNLLHVICTVKNITDRKKLEQELLDEQISHQKALTQATIDGQEKERREIGKELHDNIGQMLTTTKLYLDLAKTTADGTTIEMVSLAQKSVSDVINEIRSISHALVPPSLGDLGIIESIEELIQSISYVQLLQIDFDYFNFNEDRVPENQQLMLFRIIQEQLNNVVKHAQASRVQIRISNKGGALKLEVNDNGKGFDRKLVRKGVGLMNIKNRVELFGGKMEIISAPDKGCSLKVVVPARTEPILR